MQDNPSSSREKNDYEGQQDHQQPLSQSNRNPGGHDGMELETGAMDDVRGGGPQTQM